MNWKWHKIERGTKRGAYICYPLYPNLSIWYFIPENASYWCSFDMEGNGQLSDRHWEDRIICGKRECKIHFENNE